MSTNFASAGIPGTRLKVCVWWGGGGSHTQYRITPVPRLGAGALMLNAWDWTVTKIRNSFKIYPYGYCAGNHEGEKKLNPGKINFLAHKIQRLSGLAAHCHLEITQIMAHGY